MAKLFSFTNFSSRLSISISLTGFLFSAIKLLWKALYTEIESMALSILILGVVLQHFSVGGKLES